MDGIYMVLAVVAACVAVLGFERSRYERRIRTLIRQNKKLESENASLRHTANETNQAIIASHDCAYDRGC